MNSSDAKADNTPRRDNLAVDFTEEAKARKIIMDVLEEMKADRDRLGSYRALVPLEFARKVYELTEKHYGAFEDAFQHDPELFAETMAQNWVAKWRAFPRLAQSMGYIDISSHQYVSEDKVNSSSIACLTRSSSYVFLGPGAIGPSNKGTSMDYIRLPLRADDRVQNESHDAGVYLFEVPQKGERLRIAGTTDLLTSEIVSVWMKPVSGFSAEDRQTFNQTMETGTQTINAQTLDGYRRRIQEP